MNRAFKYLSIGIIVVLLQSCAVGPDYREPEVQNPETFRFAGSDRDSIYNIKWWELFKDPKLQELIKTGLAQNKNLKIAASRIEQARANLGYNNADFGPKFGMYGNVSKSNTILNLPDGNNHELFNGGMSMNWELDFWGKYRRSSESAQAELLATFYGKRAVEIALISEIATNYFLLLDYRTRLDISQKTEALRNRALQIIQARFDKGYTHVIDVNQAQIQKGIAQAAIPVFKRLVAQTEHNLSVLLGENPHAIETQSDLNLADYEIPKDIPEGIPSDVLKRRPDVLQVEQYYRSQNALVGVAQAMRFPSISLTGILGVGTTDLTNLTMNGLGWSAGASLLGPLFEWGKNKRRVEMERAKAKQALLQYENTVLNAFREVENSLVEISTLREELAANKFTMEAARNASKLSLERYMQGVTSYLEVIENQRQEFEANLRYVRNFQEFLNAYVGLYKALGGGWISDEELNKYVAQAYPNEQVNKDTIVYSGQIVDLYLTSEERKARKEAEKEARKKERAWKRESRKNKKVK